MRILLLEANEINHDTLTRTANQCPDVLQHGLAATRSIDFARRLGTAVRSVTPQEGP